MRVAKRPKRHFLRLRPHHPGVEWSASPLMTFISNMRNNDAERHAEGVSVGDFHRHTDERLCPTWDAEMQECSCDKVSLRGKILAIVNEIKEARSQSRYSLARAPRRRLLFTLDVFHMVHQQPYRMYRRSQQARSLNDCSA